MTAINKAVYGGRTLIDLTDDTVVAEALLKGYTAHKADGTVITGTLFDGYPDSLSMLMDPLTTQDGDVITTQSGYTIEGQAVYKRQ